MFIRRQSYICIFDWAWSTLRSPDGCHVGLVPTDTSAVLVNTPPIRADYIEQMPLGATGKILKTRLREVYAGYEFETE
jgi:hypothetical protein